MGIHGFADIFAPELGGRSQPCHQQHSGHSRCLDLVQFSVRVVLGYIGRSIHTQSVDIILGKYPLCPSDLAEGVLSLFENCQRMRNDLQRAPLPGFSVYNSLTEDASQQSIEASAAFERPYLCFLHVPYSSLRVGILVQQVSNPFFGVCSDYYDAAVYSRRFILDRML